MMYPAESHDRARKIRAGVKAKALRRLEESQYRLSDPVEEAKTYLRQRGFHVFAENVLSWNLRNSRLIVVGQNSMEPEAVIEMAERIRARVG